jgi:uncharacterized protein (DUF169 family)
MGLACDNAGMEIQTLGKDLEQLLGTRGRPVAIAFRDEPPAGVRRIDAAQPAGCGYWRLASDEGRVFYTDATDHHGCPVGAHTHAVPLPAEVGAQLQGMLGTMFSLGYLRPEEVATIPTRRTPFAFAVYSPLADAPVAPDVVLVRGNTRQLMLLAEAAQAVGMASDGATLGRPTCAVLPQALNSGHAASSFGCIGNRVYTGATDDEAYYAIPGPRLAEVVGQLATIVKANEELEKFHRARLA